MCTRVYKHTRTHHPNTRKNREIYKTNPLSLPLQKHSLPHQQKALTMNKLEKSPIPIPPRTRMQVLRNTCDTRACNREIGQYKWTKCAYTSAYVHPHSRVNKRVWIQIHRHTHTHIYTNTHAPIHAYMHTHIHTHAYAHVCTDRKSQ